MSAAIERSHTGEMLTYRKKAEVMNSTRISEVMADKEKATMMKHQA